MFLFDEYLTGSVAVPAPPSKDVPSVEDSPAEDSPSSQDGEFDQFDLTPFDPSAAHAARVAKKAARDAAAAARVASREAKAQAKAAADEEATARKRAEADLVAAEIGHFAGPSELAAALSELAAADEVSLDLETTALTPWVAPTAPGAAQKLGNGLTVRQYTARFDCTLDTTPRARIVSLQALPRGSAWAFDLDTLSPDERIALVSGLHGKIWVGHNLAFDLMWLRSIVPDVTPRGVIDTMLLNITHVPEFEFSVRDLMGSPIAPGYLCEGGEFGHWGLPGVLGPSTAAHRMMGTMLAQRDARAHAAASGEPGRALPLDFLSVALLGEKLDKAFQKPHNWMPSTLTRGHYAYCVGDITQPPQIARILLGVGPSAPVSELRAAIASHPGATAYNTFVRGAIRLTAMQRTGIYMDRAGTAAYVQTHTTAAAEHAEKLLTDMPELTPFKADLLSPDKGLTDDLKRAFAQGLTRITGVAPELTDTGLPKLDAKSLKMQYRDLPALTHYAALSGALKRASMASAYLAQADENSRLHPLVSIATVTGRTASQEPNLQNAPRGQDFRALFSAPPGKQIIAVDYSAIEMRIAAALTLRAYKRFRAVLDAAAAGNKQEYEKRVAKMGLHWYLGDVGRANKDGSLSAIDALVYLIRTGTNHPQAVQAAGERPALEGSSIDDWRNYYAGLLYEIVAAMRAAGAFQADPARDRLALADVFARGLDPHIITALSTEAAAGRFDLQKLMPVDFVARLDKQAADALKKSLKNPRQAAKAQNFGLLYGMQGAKLHAYGITNYGLDWTLEEAEFAALAWFQLYPEVRLWHLLTRGVRRKLFADSEEPQKLFRSTTLTGRPVCSDKLPSALNFQDQGTGAEIALAAIARLPSHLAGELVNFVHDELVFECPADLVDERIEEINKTMIDAADAILKNEFAVPTEVEAAAGDFWIH